MAAMAPPWRRPSSDSNCNRFAAVPCEQHLGGGGCGFDPRAVHCRGTWLAERTRAALARKEAQGVRLCNCTSLPETCAKGSAANRKAGAPARRTGCPVVVASFGGQVSRAVVAQDMNRTSSVDRAYKAVQSAETVPCANGRSPPRSRFLSSYHHT
jgi:hypothetical protein